MANLVEVLLKAIDGVSPVVKGIASETDKANKDMAEKWSKTGGVMQSVGIAAVAIGAGIEALARSNAPLLESTRRLADYLDMDSKAMQQLVIDTSNVSFPLNEVLTLMETGARLGLDSAESLKKYAEFWDMVGDATGESSTALAEAGVSLKALGISAGEEGKALNAFGFIQRNTTMEVGEFINSIGRLAPEMKQLGIGVNEAAVIMGILQQEFGMTSRVAMQEFRTAVTSADGDIEKLKTTLGITGEMFDTYSQKVADSSEIISENARRNNELLTPMQNLQHWLTEVKYKMGDFIASAANYAPVLTGIGSAMTIIGTVMKSSFLPQILLATKAVWAFTASILANPLTFWIGAIGLVITSLVLLWKNWDNITEWISRKVDWIVDKFKWLGDGIKWVANFLGIYKEKTVEVVEATDKLGESADKANTSLDGMKTTTEGTGEAVVGLAEGNIALGDSLGEVAIKADEAKGKLNEWGQVIETFDEWVFRLGEESKVMAEKSAKAFEDYSNAMKPVKDRIDELTLSEGEYALKTINIVESLKEKRAELEENVKAAGLSAEEEKKAMDDISEWYDLEIAEIIKKLGEKKEALIAAAKQAGKSASEEKVEIASVTAAYNAQIGTLGALANAKAKAATKAAATIYKVVDSEGNTIALRSQNQLSAAEKAEGITLVAMHSGGMVRTAIPGGEGLALLKDREIVSTPEQAASGNNITLNIHEGAFKVTTNKLDENAIKKAGKWLFDEFYSQCRANNIILQRG